MADVRLRQPGPARRRCVGTLPDGRPPPTSTRAVAAAARRRSGRGPGCPVPARAEVIAAAGRRPRRPQGRAGRPRRPRGRQDPRRGGRRRAGGHRHGRFVAGQGRAALGETVPSELPDKLAWTTRQPGRRRRDDHAVELPGRHPVVEVLPGPARRQRHRAQAVRARAAVRRGASSTPASRRASPPTSSASCTATPSRPRPSPSTPASARVSFTGSVPTGRKVAAAAMAAGPKLVSLELGGKNAMIVLRRRRPRPRRRRRAVRRVRHRRPALHVDVAPRRAPRRRRRARRARIAKRADDARARRPARRRPPTSARSSTAASAERIVAMVERGGRRGRRPSCTGGARASTSTGCEGGDVLRADDPHRRAPDHTHRPRGGVRAGARGDRGRRPRRGDRRRERHRVRAVGRGLHARHQRRAAGRRRASTPASST